MRRSTVATPDTSPDTSPDAARGAPPDPRPSSPGVGLYRRLRAHVVLDPVTDEMDLQDRAGRPDDTDAQRLRDGVRRGWLFSAVWLGYLLQPFQAVWTRGDSLTWQVVGTVSLVAFAAVFLLGFRDFRGRLYAERGIRVSRSWAVVVAMLLLLVLVAPAAGDAVLTGCVFVAVLGVMTLPPAQGVLVVVLNLVAVEVLPRIVPGWTRDDSAVFSVLVATFAAWGVGQLVTRNIELSKARRRLAELAIVEERERLGRDVQDILGHSLTVITVKAELAGRLVALDPDRAAREIADVEALSRAALADVRSTVGGLRHLRLETELPGVRSAVEAAGMTLTTEGGAADVDEDLRELFAWTLREAVTNAVRHSGGTGVRVVLEARRIIVADDGAGPCGESEGTGLRGLTARAEAAGATVRVARGSDGGFVLTVAAP